jgi:hypothetical protein
METGVGGEARAAVAPLRTGPPARGTFPARRLYVTSGTLGAGGGGDAAAVGTGCEGARLPPDAAGSRRPCGAPSDLAAPCPIPDA